MPADEAGLSPVMNADEPLPLAVLDFVGIEYGEGAQDSLAGAVGIAQAIEAGCDARLAGPMEPRDLAAPSTPVIGTAFLR